MSTLWIMLQIIVLAFVSMSLAVAVSNMRILRRLGDFSAPRYLPRVSILLPARNEEANIAPCVRSLLAQDYADFEVLVLNDNSEDRTPGILSEIAASNSRLRVLRGKPLPSGWQGKNWACHQLAQAAGGELLLFTDADTLHHPRTLADAVAALVAQDVDLLTAFPRQEVLSWSERLLVPVLTWSFIVFLPLRLAYRSHRPELSIAMGQFMLFRRQAYDQTGGHASIKRELVDDMALGRSIKAHSLRWRLVDGSQRVRCRMYHSFREVFQGLSKNLFPGFQYNASLFVLMLLWAGILTLSPVLTLLLSLVGATVSGLSAGLAATAMGVTLLLTGLSYPRFDFPSYLAFLYPITAVMTITVALWSLALAALGGYTWKGRRLLKQRIHWW